MAKKIYMTNADVENVLDELRGTLVGMKCYGQINIKRSFKSDERSAFIYFTPIAWLKMATLVARYDTEVQWHGLVRRISEFEFEIYDIVVPPHEVTGTTVTSEYAPYADWLNALDDDTFNAVKFHGHSHAGMSVSPSGVDEKYRTDLITQLPKPANGMDVFYIFMIINKKHEWSAEIYDLTNNALYETEDIFVDTCLNDLGECLEDFMAEAKKVAVSRTYTSGAYKGGKSNHYSSPYGYNSSYYNEYHQPANTTPMPKPDNCQTSYAKKTRKPKGKKNEEKGKCCGFDTWEEYYDALYADAGYADLPEIENSDIKDEDDPTDPFYVKG